MSSVVCITAFDSYHCPKQRWKDFFIQPMQILYSLIESLCSEKGLFPSSTSSAVQGPDLLGPETTATEGCAGLGDEVLLLCMDSCTAL